MDVVKPIETTYRGVRFRSRLEARWACCFDALGIEWVYEHEGYETPYGRYLPDFWLPQVSVDGATGVLFEVKPSDWRDDLETHPEMLTPTLEAYLPVTPHVQLNCVARNLGVGGMLARGFRYDGDYWPGLEEVAPHWDHPMAIDLCGCGAVTFRIANGHFRHEPHCAKANPVQSAYRVERAYRIASAYRYWEGK